MKKTVADSLLESHKPLPAGNHGQHWTDREDAFLTSNAGAMTQDAMAAALGRTRYAVKDRIKTIGATTKSCDSWSDAEISILIAEYPRSGARGASLALKSAGHNRKQSAVSAKAVKLRLVRFHNKSVQIIMSNSLSANAMRAAEADDKTLSDWIVSLIKEKVNFQ